jgi:2-iminoacetate synthase ThiH
VDIDHWVALIQAAAQSGLRVRAGTLADLLAFPLPFEQVLARFAQAGAQGWVGVQGVCLTGSWRAKHGQLPADDWLAALAKASQVLGVTLGLQVGAGERPAERVAHWVRLREALDQGLVATGVHTALVTGLGASGTAHDWLVATALAKFMFPDVATHQVAWRPGLVGVAQSAFELGANALGPVVLPDARATWESTIRDVHRNLTACGLRAAWPVDSPLASLVQSSNRIHR